MRFFSGLFDALKVDRTPYQASLAQFPSVDGAKAQRELDLDKRGSARGAQDLPPFDHAGLDEVELEITSRFDHHYAEARETLANNLQVYAGRLSRLDNGTVLNSVESEFDNAMSDFKAGVITDANRLFLLRENVIEVEQEYAAFRRNRGLERTAKYPAHRFLNFAVVALFGLLEVIANAVFFSSTHPSGWLGAIFESVFISVVNVTVGLAAGFFLVRGLYTRNGLAKLLSFVLLVAALAFLLGFNVFAAHYRDVFASLPPETLSGGRDVASLEAFKRLLDKLWILNGFQSYLMVIVGVIVGGIAMFEGYKLDDPVPGFGITARHRERTVHDYADTKEMLLAGLQERKDEALSEINYLIEEIQRRDEEYASVVEARRSLISRFNAVVGHLESTANHLLEQYRGANKSARAAPLPDHFKRAWLPAWEREEIPADDKGGERGRAAQAIVLRLGEARRQFLQAYDSAVTQYQRIDQIVSKEALQNARAEII